MEAGKRCFFPNGQNFEMEAATSAAAENGVELRLGLSTNGQFGLDLVPKRLKRSVSVSGPLASNYFLLENATAHDKEARGNSVPLAPEAMPVKMEIGDGARRWIGNMTTGQTVKDGNGSSGSNGPVLNSGGSSSHGSAGRTPNLPPKGVISTTTTFEVEGDENEVKKTLMEMPYVSTGGYGPNGSKTHGFLYRYKSADDLKIMCVCHGQFWTPAEFVKHGGGDDTAAAQPLKNIVMNKFPFP